MPLKTYRGPSTGALLARVQAELGEDAVVLRTAQVGGLIEIIAADPESATAVAALMDGQRGRRPGGQVGQTRATAAAPVTAQPPVRPSVLALLGPTGAGKTTTIAKLAAHPKVFEGRRVGLLCLDTYRVGAVEQLGAYAEINRVPLEVAYQASEVDAALRRLRGSEVILVDCPGRGPRGQQDADAVRDVLRRVQPDEVHLVLPAGIQAPLARRLVEHHRARGATHVIASKVDEVPDDWTVFEVAAGAGMPMRWLADGQRVPQDIRSAAPRLEAVKAGGRRTRALRQDGVA